MHRFLRQDPATDSLLSATDDDNNQVRRLVAVQVRPRAALRAALLRVLLCLALPPVCHLLC